MIDDDNTVIEKGRAFTGVGADSGVGRTSESDAGSEGDRMFR